MQTDQVTNSTTVIRAHDGPAFQAIFINNGQKVLSCGEDHRICKWDTTNQKLEAEFLSHDGPAYELGCNATSQTYHLVLYQAHTWLANRALAERWAGALGLKALPRGYFDFPAGSMFWARAEALAPLCQSPAVENFKRSCSSCPDRAI